MRRRETLQIQIDQTEMREQVSGRFGRIRIERVRCGCGNSRVRFLNQGWPAGNKMGPQIAQKRGQKMHHHHVMPVFMSAPNIEKNGFLSIPIGVANSTST